MLADILETKLVYDYIFSHMFVLEIYHIRKAFAITQVFCIYKQNSEGCFADITIILNIFRHQNLHWF